MRPRRLIVKFDTHLNLQRHCAVLPATARLSCIQVGSLSLDSELMSLAQQWAEHLASIRALKHSNIKYHGQPVGENVAAKSGTSAVDYTG